MATPKFPLTDTEPLAASIHELPSWVALLQRRAQRQRDQRGYTFLTDGELAEVSMSYGQLDARARAIAALLQESDVAGERVLLLYPPGLGYLESFFGCLYAGAIAVPAYPPRIGNASARITAIAQDATPSTVLTTPSIRTRSSGAGSAGRLAHARWLAPEIDATESHAEQWRDPRSDLDTLAFLQYTSGSTADPKGVMVSHGNLMQNVAASHECFGISADTVGVSWLPPYHDMGLIGGLLNPLFGGFAAVLMSPLAFLQRPARWLQAISRFHATLSQGPNSAFQLCVDRVPADIRATLDLSSWITAVNGAEPIRADVMERFVEAFRDCGFRPEAFTPCYGLAESTLIVSGSPHKRGPLRWSVERESIQQGAVAASRAGGYAVVGSGTIARGLRAVIVDPDRTVRCQPDQVGEIWVSGASVAQGYWNRPDATESTFRAYLPTGEGPFLRTGDLGVLHDGELFVTGRLTDLVIIRGRNYYPQDLEASVTASHPALEADRGAAFSADIDGQEQLVIVQEVPRRQERIDQPDAVVEAIRRAVVDDHLIQPHSIVLVRHGNVPRTSSGKVQRRACRELFIADALDVVARWTAPPEPAESIVPTGGTSAPPTADAIRSWLRTRIASQLGLDPDTIGISEPFSSFGLDSVQAVAIAGELEDWTGCRVEPTIAWDHPTIDAAARFLAGEVQPSRLAPVRAADEPVAVVGLGCRFPGGVGSPGELWELLCAGRDGVVEVPADRWDVDAWYDADPDAPGKMSTRCGAFVEGVDQFDAPLFGISPREAAFMDPQQRLLLEVTWEALEHAGIAPDSRQGSSTGVFVGISTSDYAFLVNNTGQIDGYAGTGNAHSVAANRLSYALGWRGPSLAVDTACSSSLVAVHLACQSLRAGECEVAVAGGVNLLLLPETMVNFSKARMLAADGRCKTFDAAADGYGRGEGCGVVVLRRLSEAVAAGDEVWAVIRGSAVNQDGRSNGLTAPSGPSQEEVVRRALAVAGVAPGEVGYVEAHGTGTALGDPIELRALGRVLGERSAPLVVGSVKTNLGHLEAAAGVAGLIKAVLSVRHGEIPAHLHFRDPNPHIDWGAWPVTVPTVTMPWPPGRRVAGVSSFGFGGTNAHVVIEDHHPDPDRDPAPTGDGDGDGDGGVVVKLAARDEYSLGLLAARWGDHLDAHPDVGVGAVAATANLARAELPERAAVVAATTTELVAGLRAVAAGRPARHVARGHANPATTPKIGFLVPGQGARAAGAAAALYGHDPAFTRTLDRLGEVIGPLDELPLAALIDPGADAAAALTHTEVAQPALYALALALAAWWADAGIHPDVVAGHSAGAYAAAAIAGVFSPEHGAHLITTRAQLMAQLPPGTAMAAVHLDEHDARHLPAVAAGHLTIAAVNTPHDVVLAGDHTTLTATLTTLTTPHQLLPVTHAFHTAHVDPILQPLHHALTTTALQAPTITFISDTTGTTPTPDELTTPTYWTTHTRQPTRFTDTLTTLAHHATTLIELGPANTLLAMARTTLTTTTPHLLASLHPTTNPTTQRHHNLATLWTTGTPIPWTHHTPPPTHHHLPTYPFHHRRYWLPQPTTTTPTPPTTPTTITTPLPHHLTHTTLTTTHHPYLHEHTVHGHTLIPGVTYLHLLLTTTPHTTTPTITNLTLHQPLIHTPHQPPTLHITHHPPTTTTHTATIHSHHPHHPNPWTHHATATINPHPHHPPPPPPTNLDDVETRFPVEVPVDQYYEELRSRGLDYGPCFRAIVSLRRNDVEALAELRLPDAVGAGHGKHVHEVLLDAGLQVLGATLASRPEGALLFVPVEIGRVTLHQQPLDRVWCRARLHAERGDTTTVVGDVELSDDAGAMVAELRDVVLRPLSREVIERFLMATETESMRYEVTWRRQDVPRPTGAPAGGKRLLVLCDRTGAGADLAERAEANGDAVVLVNDEPPRRDNGDAASSAPSLDRIRDELRRLVDQHGPFDHVVHMWSLDERGAVPAGAAASCSRAVAVVQELMALGRPLPQLWLVTRGAQPARGDVEAPGQAALWGVGRTVRLEHPGLRCTCVDLDPDDESAGAADLYAELDAASDERSVAYRSGGRLVERLVRRPASVRSQIDRPAAPLVRLESRRPGILDELTLVPAERRPPERGEVEIRVRVAGLNFRDVLNALGTYPGDPVPLGGELAGTVVAAGADVTGLAIGDEVVAIAPAAFSSRVTVDARLVARIPPGVSHEQAATIPIAFLTAWWGLIELAGLRRGDRVLIHAGTGGVGMAAIALARHAGAEIYATAGSPEKRRHLEQLGVAHVMDSRSTEFASIVRRHTDGTGVDVVLNSLGGDAIPAGFAALRPGGHFIEIGKADIWDPARLATLDVPISYHAFDLAELCRDEPDRVQSMLAEVLDTVAAGQLQPLPLRAFAAAEAPAAFRHMARARHIGKIVLTFDDRPAGPDHTGTTAAATVGADATYLVTGGLGALGAAAVRWLVQQGARHVVALSRRVDGTRSEQLRAGLPPDVNIVTAPVDVADREQLARILQQIDDTMPPLRGVIHAAGVLDDGVIAQQSWARFAAVFRPKVAGAWNLHTLTESRPIDFFVMYSSLASIFGSAGQANYAAANASLDALAHHRRAHGLPATSINWGPWQGDGMAAEVTTRRAAMNGIRPMDVDAGVSALGDVLRDGSTQSVVAAVDWSAFGEQFASSEWPPLLADLGVATTAAEGRGASSRDSVVAELRRLPEERRHAVLVDRLVEHGARVLGLEASESLDPARPLADLGLDSLMGVELTNVVGRMVDLELPTTLLFDHPTVNALAEFLLGELFPSEVKHDPVDTDPDRDRMIADIERLSDEEAEALIDRSLTSLLRPLDGR